MELRVPITKPYFGEEEKKAVNEVLDSGWLVQGPKVAEFERLFCEYTGAKFARTSTSCTASLHLALIASGVTHGDEVLVPSFTYVASANSVEYTGAKPVFVDIDLKTFNIDVQKLAQYLEQAKKQGSKVKGIMPVHLFGLAADMDPIMELARKYNLCIIEDAACALGSYYKAKHAGTFGDAGCFSLHPRKPITTGEGGMLITNNPEVASKVQSLRDHGAAVSDLARHEKGGFMLPAFNVLGYNYRMTDIQGAIGVEQMKKFPWVVSQRIEKAKTYDEELRDIEWLQTPCVPEGYKHTYQSYVTLVQNPKFKQLTLDAIQDSNQFRNKIMAKLEEEGIATRQGTHAVHTLNYYKMKYDIAEGDYLNALAADKLSMTLPLYPQMTDEEQEYVIERIK
ncbi:MAG TPA: DegT/DnrJ/EryC1/StrS family aminotransferase, partial [Dehalococcoidia bacterium]|nr:DegT/DnrJ/EryC1/StrS family aminotransferase [Dehalococcoidia bacterium]